MSELTSSLRSLIKTYLYEPGSIEIYERYQEYINQNINKLISWNEWYSRNNKLEIKRSNSITYWLKEKERCEQKIIESFVYHTLLKI